MNAINDVDRSRDYDRDTFRSDDPDLEAYEYENEEDGGVRMPLFLILALVVIAAIVGVWFVAYQQGLQDGRAEQQGPSFIAGQDGERVAPDDPGGIPAPRDSDVFGESFDGTGSDIVPRDEQIIELPTPPRPGIEVVDSLPPAGEPDLRVPGAPTDTVVAEPLSPPTVSDFPEPVTIPEAPAAQVPAPGNTTFVPPPSTDVRVTPPSSGLAPSRVPAPPPTATAAVPAPNPTPDNFGPPQAQPGGPSGNFVVQLASLPSQNAADQTWTRIFSRMTDILSGYQKDVQVADLGAKGVFYRLRIGYFPDRSAAGNLCQQLKSRGQDCIVASR